MRQLIEDLISAMEYHVEQTRPIHSTTVALQAAREALKAMPTPLVCDCNQGQVCHVCDPITPPEQPAPVQEPSNYNEFVETACALIKAADDAAADRDYMLDSDDCIAVLRGTWKAPLANDMPKQPTPTAQPAVQEPVAWVDALFDAIKHGDAEHQNWLQEKLKSWVIVNPPPTPPAAPVPVEWMEMATANLVRADEREACWRLCDALWIEGKDAHDCREAIRARGNT
jgi:hypothetical protein